MIIVITPESMVHKETDIINQLFQEGLDLLHIRKPFISHEEMTGFIRRIDPSHHSQLVLHSHYDIGEQFNISRFHFREAGRQAKLYKLYTGRNIISTSVHQIETFNHLENEWEYSFISPFFPSISKKGYGENSIIMEQIKHRNNDGVKMIALGGINENNINKAFVCGADGAALLGAIWENDQPLHVFKKCKKNALL